MRTAVALALSLLSSGCGPTAESPVATVLAPVTEVLARPGDYFGLAWIDGDLVFGNDLGDDRSADTPWRVLATGGNPTPIAIDSDPKCFIDQFGSPSRSPSGDLALSHLCQLEGSDASGPGVDVESIVATSLAGGSYRELSETIRRADQIALRGDQDGVFSTGSLICQGLVAISPTGNMPLEVTVEGAGASFSLADEYDPSDDCVDTGIADFPAFHPTSDELYFFGSTQAVGVSGAGRLDQPFGIYRTDGAGAAERILDGVRGPRGLAWSFDGEWLAFSGEVDGSVGVWVYRPATNERFLIHESPVDWIAWAPDSYRLAAITNDGDVVEPPQRKLIVLDASNLPRS